MGKTNTLLVKHKLIVFLNLLIVIKILNSHIPLLDIYLSETQKFISRHLQ